MSIFRNNLPDGIKDGLNQRKSAMINRTPQTIQYLNSRNAWIRMTSAVDVNESNKYAARYILQGGTLNSGGSGLKSGIGSNTSNAYSTVSPRGVTHNLGIRPMPGITSMDVTTRTAYGSLRDITVNFKCWDIKQLEDLELIYMRPGYTVLVEWGWTPYIDASGKYHPTFTDFYSNNILNPSTYDRNTILKSLYDKSIATGGNYDAMYGYIKNFEWVSRNDGGYDCKTIIKSTGEIIESLKVNYVRADLYNYGIYENSSGNGFLSQNDVFLEKSEQPSYLIAPYYQKNTLAGIWAELYFALFPSNIFLDVIRGTLDAAIGLTNILTLQPDAITNLSNIFDNVGNQVLDLFTGNEDNSVSNEEEEEGEEDIDGKVKLPSLKNNYEAISFSGLKNYGDENQFIRPGSSNKVYITLEAAFDLINEFILAKGSADGKPLIKLSTKTETYSGKDEEDLLCVAHPLQVSLDPTICLIKSPLWYESIAPALGEATSETAETATAEAAEALISIIIDGLVRSFSFDQTDKRANFLKNIEKIDDGIKYAAINNILIEKGILNEEEETVKYSGGLAEFINKFFENTTRYDVLNGTAYDENISNLQLAYDIQKHFKSLNINVEINITTDDKTKTLTEILNNVEPNLYFKNIKELTQEINAIASAGVLLIISATTRQFVTDGYASTFDSVTISITTSPVTSTAAAFVLNTKDAIASLEELESLKKNFFYEKPSKELGIIGNIYVSLDFLYRQSLSQGLESGDSKEKDEIDLYKYIKSIMSGIQTAIGNVNNFEIHIDPVDNVARIIDVNYTSPNKPSNLYTLEINKTNSIVRSYSLQSQIFPSQTTLIAAGAQSKGSKLGLQTNTLTDFNKGLTDRVLTTKTDPGDSISQSSDKDPTLAASLANIVILFAALNKEAPTDGSPNTTVDIGGLINTGKNSLRDLIVYFQQIQTESPGKNRSLLPFKFSFEMDGIGGIPIGSLFRINEEALPKGYRGTEAGVNLAQTITKVSHTLDNNNWKTKIESTSVILDRPLEGTFDEIDIRTIIKNASDNLIAQGTGIAALNVEQGGGVPPDLGGDGGNASAIKQSGDAIFEGGGKKSYCALYTYSIAKGYTDALKGISPTGQLYRGKGNANDKIYRDNLIALGYKMTELGTLTKENLKKYIDQINTIGTIINYRSTVSTGAQGSTDNYAYVYGHTQIYTGGVLETSNGSKWASSYGNNYGGGFVYSSKNSNSWEAYLFTL